MHAAVSNRSCWVFNFPANGYLSTLPTPFRPLVPVWGGVFQLGANTSRIFQVRARKIGQGDETVIGALRGWSSIQKHVVAASFLGWTLDALDFFLLVFVIKD